MYVTKIVIFGVILNIFNQVILNYLGNSRNIECILPILCFPLCTDTEVITHLIFMTRIKLRQEIIGENNVSNDIV